jgi:SNF2 family DNA or RNA helicase
MSELKLYDFQEKGVTQLFPYRSALNADDMGLGKTIQAITLDKLRRHKHNCMQTAQTLVVTKSSVMGSWANEFAKWAPELNVYVYDPKRKSLFIEALEAKNTKGHPRYNVFIVHWHALRLMPELKKVNWFHVIGDEIHHIKNRKAQMTRSFKQLATYYKSGWSGTWADNKPQDAWSVLNWLWPRHYTSYNRFEAEHVLFRTEINHKTGKTYKIVMGVHNAEAIHEQMGKAYIRRKKEEVIQDLPDKYYTTIKVALDPKQRRAYDEMANDMLAWVGKHEDEPIAAPIVAAKLVRLQQFAVAYGQMTTVTKGGKQLRQLLLDEPSSKLDAVMELIEDTDEQIVVFGQSKQAINLLGRRLASKKIPYGLLTGDTAMADRDRLVENFQSKRLRVFAGTIGAGGVGITLTAASTVVFLDRAWSPSQNLQAEDRLHRIGQKNAVQVIDIVAEGTIDSARNQKIKLKWEWLKQILEGKTDNVQSGV